MIVARLVAAGLLAALAQWPLGLQRLEAPPADWASAPEQAGAAPLRALLGRLAKTLVYGGATVAQLSSRLLCPLLAGPRAPAERPLEPDEPTLFVFADPEQPELAFRLYADDAIDGQLVRAARLNSSRATVLLVHGWLGGIRSERYLSEAKRAALAPAGAWTPNVIVVDWSQLASGSLYAATQASRLVAARLADQLAGLVRVGGLRPELMHCLGHSLGAHICGQAARAAFPPVAPSELANRTAWEPPERLVRSLGRFGRISALDPGGFCYELEARAPERDYPGLRPSDALLVDAIYTNRSPFGNRFALAQYNVRVHNAFLQRACSVWLNSSLAADYFASSLAFLLGDHVSHLNRNDHNQLLTCDHYFATRFAHQGPRAPPCAPVAYACPSYKSFARGRCGACNSSAQCYSPEFEYQRRWPSERHQLAHLTAHSSYLAELAAYRRALASQGPRGALAVQQRPPGAVAYAQRKLFYLRAGTLEGSSCVHLFRIRVRLASQHLAAQLSGRLRLSLLDARHSPVGLLDLTGNHQIHLYGPWPTAPQNDTARAATAQWAPDELLDERTLTALAELDTQADLARELGRLFGAQLTSERSDTVDKYGRQTDELVHQIHLDYLSTTEPAVRERYSRSLPGTRVSLLLAESHRKSLFS